MPNAPKDQDTDQPRVLVFSQRHVFPNVLFRAPHHEFEDIICQIDSAEIVAPRVQKWFTLRYRTAKRLGWHSPVALNPGLARTRLTKRYDLFFAICGSLVDLLMVNTVDNWRRMARTSICLLDEVWVRELESYKHYLSILAKFDIVMFYYSETAKTVSKAIGCDCMFVPPGIDSILFCPYPECHERVIGVYSIGRRSAITHQALIKMMSDRGLLYVYDSIAGGSAVNSKEHRLLLANMAKRSRYFMVNPALIDRPDVRGDQNEIGNRYFEGAASGAIMIGEQPRNEEFAKLFDWPDAVLYLPYDSGSIGSLISEIDRQPDRQETIRRNNVANALMRHDWAYRWETVLKAAGLRPMQGLLDRKERLQHLARDISEPVTPDSRVTKEVSHADADTS